MIASLNPVLAASGGSSEPSAPPRSIFACLDHPHHLRSARTVAGLASSLDRGPEIRVHFESAEGLIAGKTPVLCRSVPVGTVAKIELADDLKGVVVTVDTNREAARLLVEDSQIWIVRARYSSAGISGLNTLVSGNYLGLQPGVSKNRRQDFTGLEDPPPTPPGVPGLRFKLIADAGRRPRTGRGNHLQRHHRRNAGDARLPS